MDEVAADVPQVSDLREFVEAGRIWVAEVGAEIAGYISAEVLDGNAHVAQVSVAPDHAGRAIGRALIEPWRTGDGPQAGPPPR
jgi:ribosomal protein S18 acetylase RimI-like enzyme